MAIRGFFIITILSPIATFCKKTAIFGRSRGVMGAKRLKTLSKNACFLFNFQCFSMLFIEKPPTMQQKLRPDVATDTSGRNFSKRSLVYSILFLSLQHER